MALHFAIRNKLLTEVRQLVESGEDVNAGDHDLRTPLMMCCLEKDETWASGVARMLLQAGARVGRTDRNGRSALMFSVLFNRQRLTLLYTRTMDFDINQVDVYGNTALHYCSLCGNLENMKTVLNTALRRNLDPLTRNKLGQTPLSLAMQVRNELCMSMLIRSTSHSEQDFLYKVPTELALQPWREEFQFVYHPDLMRKCAIDQSLESARVHKSRPTMDLDSKRAVTKHRKSSSRLTSRGRRRFVSNSSSKRQSPDVFRVASAKHQYRPPTTADLCEDCYSPDSWKSFLPDFLLLMQEQRSSSYRLSAPPSRQPFEEILSMFPDEKASVDSEETWNGASSSSDTSQACIGNRRKTPLVKGGSTESISLARGRSKPNALEVIVGIHGMSDAKRRGRKQTVAPHATETPAPKKKLSPQTSSDILEVTKCKSETKASKLPPGGSKAPETRSKASKQPAASSSKTSFAETEQQPSTHPSAKPSSSGARSNDFLVPKQPCTNQTLGLRELDTALSDIVEE